MPSRHGVNAAMCSPLSRAVNASICPMKPPTMPGTSSITSPVSSAMRTPSAFSVATSISIRPLSSTRSGSTSKLTMVGGASGWSAVVLLPGSVPVSIASTLVVSVPESPADVVGVGSPVLAGLTKDVASPETALQPVALRLTVRGPAVLVVHFSLAVYKGTIVLEVKHEGGRMNAWIAYASAADSFSGVAVPDLLRCLRGSTGTGTHHDGGVAGGHQVDPRHVVSVGRTRSPTATTDRHRRERPTVRRLGA